MSKFFMLLSGTVRQAILYRDRSCCYSKDPEDGFTVEAMSGSVSVELDWNTASSRHLAKKKVSQFI